MGTTSLSPSPPLTDAGSGACRAIWLGAPSPGLSWTTPRCLGQAGNQGAARDLLCYLEPSVSVHTAASHPAAQRLQEPGLAAAPLCPTPPTRARSCRTCSGPIPPSPGQTLRAAQRLWPATPQPAAGPGCAPLPGCCREPLAEDYRAHILSLPSSSLGQCSRFSHPPRLPPGPKYGAARLSCCT